MHGQNLSAEHQNLQKAYNLSSPEDNINFYKEWANEYEQDFAIGMDYILPFQVASLFLKQKVGGPVLDIGAGTGLLGAEIRKQSEIELHATDISAEMLLIAEKKRVYKNNFVGDLSKGLPVGDNSYNGVVSSGTFTHGHLGPEALFEVRRILSKDGLAVVSINSKHWDSLGFDKAQKSLELSGSETSLTKVRIYGDKCKADARNDTAYLLMFTG
ncbi:class I SAM-dependent methyltransferase [Paracoccaceae bacterium]|nr:class I SAM-dependent methyltransferase [Paracoccaceae bacterium]